MLGTGCVNLRKLVRNLQINCKNVKCVKFIYLIVPFWYASAAYQASLVEPWFVFWRDEVDGYFGETQSSQIPMARPNEPDMPPKRTKKVLLGIYRTQIQPKI